MKQMFQAHFCRSKNYSKSIIYINKVQQPIDCSHENKKISKYLFDVNYYLPKFTCQRQKITSYV